jgi:alpha-L-rhamnosidase
MVHISNLQVEHHESGFGIDSPNPRLSWRFENPNGVKDWKQASYEIKIKQRGESKASVVKEEENVLVPWLGHTLQSREKVEVEVRAMGSDGTLTESKSITVEAGLLEKGDWKAEVVGGAKIGGPRGPLRPVRVWGKFEWDGKSASAR